MDEVNYPKSLRGKRRKKPTPRGFSYYNDLYV